MDSAAAQQQEEIDALQSIYGQDFTLAKPSTVWKGASALTEFSIRIKHPDADLEQRVAITLHARLPKTYPDKAVPAFSIQNALGLSSQQVAQLTELVKAEAQRNAGHTMVFDVASYCQEWILSHNVAAKATPNISLATQMTNRTIEAERKRAQQAVKEEEQKQQEEARRAAEFAQKVELAQAVQQQREERVRQQRVRKRGHSISTDATGMDGGEVITFDHEIEYGGVKFEAVRICCRRKEFMWTTHFAEPAYYNNQMTVPPLELYTVCFDSQYYTSQQGRRKTREVQEDLKKLIALRSKQESKFLLEILAVQLHHATAATPTKLHILAEQRPSMTLYEILQAVGKLSAEKSCDYLVKILSALNVLHAEGMFHRGLCAKCIHVVQTPGATKPSVKLSRSSYYTRLVDLHKSNAFSVSAEEELRIPQSWIMREVSQNPLQYTRVRDLWNVGMVLLQMLFGLDVLDRYSDFRSVINLSDFPQSLREITTGMFEPSKKSPWSCLRLLDELQGVTFTPSASVPIPIPPRSIATSRFHASSSPETEVGSSPHTAFGRRSLAPSRYHAEFDELEHLGSGGFGEVVKARNKLDGKIYAVKKIRLRSGDTDARIFREVTTLSRLNHRYIVRYYATWLEDIDGDGEGDTDSATESDSSISRSRSFGDASFGRPGDELDMSFSNSRSRSKTSTSFPYVVFGNEDDDGGSPGEDDFEEDEDDEEEDASPVIPRTAAVESRQPRQVLYISMEFVEKETLKERIDEGLEEDEAWRLFHQVLDALVHMSSLGIIHRDLKPSNVFMDAKGDAKVGDFGLATSSIADVAPSDMPAGGTTDPEITKDVGTRLYVAPEVFSGRSKARSQAKADMYSLGICFFEMNYKFSTGAERIHVIEDLRKPQIIFPTNWPAGRERQKQMITLLLQHDPDKRPSALELSHSDLLPPRVADEFFKETLSVMTRPDSTHYMQVVKALFAQPYNAVKASTYNAEKERLDLMALSGVAVEKLKDIFTKHGAVEMEPPLLGPVTDLYHDADSQDGPATFLDSNGDLVTLPKNLLVPFARMAVRRDIARIKRFCIGDAYVQTGIGHPDRLKVAAFDILTPDANEGPLAAAAEALSIADECLNSFPGLGDSYKIYISHSALTEAALAKVPGDLRSAVYDILGQTKSSFPQKRVNLLRLGLNRAVVDSLETWNEPTDAKGIVAGWNTASHGTAVIKAIADLEQTIKFATALGVRRPILVRAIMMRPSLYDQGIHFDVNRGPKRSDKFAAGGSYEHLFARLQPGKGLPGVSAVGVQVSVNTITAALDQFQRTEKQKLQRSRTSFGFWSPRRTDVYVISRQLGQLEERLEVVSALWSHNISADVMYDSAIESADPEQEPIAVARREGILFCVILPASSKTSRRDFRVRNVLSDKEHEVSRHDLPMWLASEIANQRRVDLTTAGVSVASSDVASPPIHFQHDPAAVGIEILMPNEDRKQAKWARLVHHTKVEQIDGEVRAAVAAGIPMIAIDVDSALFNTIVMSNKWLFEDDAWRAVVAQFPQKHTNYAWTIREQLLAYREREAQMVMLLCLKDFRVFMFRLTRT